MKSTYSVEQHWNIVGIPVFPGYGPNGILSISGLQVKECSAQSSGRSTYQPLFRH